MVASVYRGQYGQKRPDDAPAALLSIGVRPQYTSFKCLADVSSDLFLTLMTSSGENGEIIPL